MAQINMTAAQIEQSLKCLPNLIDAKVAGGNLYARTTASEWIFVGSVEDDREARRIVKLVLTNNANGN